MVGSDGFEDISRLVLSCLSKQAIGEQGNQQRQRVIAVTDRPTAVVGRPSKGFAAWPLRDRAAAKNLRAAKQSIRTKTDSYIAVLHRQSPWVVSAGIDKKRSRIDRLYYGR